MQVYCSCTCWTLGSSWKGPMKWGLSTLTSCWLLGCFLGTGSVGFSGFWHGTRNLCQVVCNRAGFFWKLFLRQKLGKWPKIGFLNLKKILVINFP